MLEKLAIAGIIILVGLILYLYLLKQMSIKNVKKKKNKKP